MSTRVYRTRVLKNHFRLSNYIGACDFSSGALHSFPIGWQRRELWARSDLEIIPVNENYRVRLSLSPGAVADLWCDGQRDDWSAVMSVLRHRTFDAIAIPELLSGLTHAYRNPRNRRVASLHDDLLGRLTYEPQRERNEPTVAAYIDFSPDELSAQPPVTVIRCVLRYASQTFPWADVELTYATTR